MKVMVNGTLAASVDARDRGLQYGDGVFETMAVRNGAVRFLDAHLERLQRGCRGLGMPPQDLSRIQAEMAELIRTNQLDRGDSDDAVNTAKMTNRSVIKLVVTRGISERGYAPPAAPECNRILYLSPWPDGLDEQVRLGVAIKVCETQLGLNPALAGIKHLNRLEQVLASQELADTGFVEGVMLDAERNVVEATRSNVFMVEDKRLVTPALERCGVAGVMRARVMQLACDHGIETSTETVAGDRLYQCEEVFLCNAVAGIVPVTSIESRALRVGAVTRRLQSLLRAEYDL